MKRTDVIVVGAGAVGLSAAWYLQRAGCSVTVVTRDPVGRGASAGNAGMIVPSHLVPLASPGVIAQGIRWLASRESPFHIRRRVDPGLFRWLWLFRRYCTERHVAYAAPILKDLSIRSVGLIAELQDDIGDFGWKQTGLMMLYRTEKYRGENLRAADLAETHGLRIRRLDRHGIMDVEPNLRSDADGGVLYEDDGRIDPEAFLTRIATAIEREGGEIRENVTVRGIAKPANGSTTVQTDRGPLRAQQIVLAAGAWGGRLGPENLPVQPAKGYSITVDAVEDGPRVPMILSEEKVTVTPLPDRLRFGGTLSLSGFDATVDLRRVAPIRAQAVRYRPDLDPEQMDVSGIWSGFRPASPDGLPIIGRLRPRQDVIVATGHGMMGITLAPVTGRVVADLVTDRRSIIDPTPLSPYRF